MQFWVPPPPPPPVGAGFVYFFALETSDLHRSFVNFFLVTCARYFPLLSGKLVRYRPVEPVRS